MGLFLIYIKTILEQEQTIHWFMGTIELIPTQEHGEGLCAMLRTNVAITPAYLGPRAR